ncbi:MAG: hypothetical protein HYY76_06740 [Acidobacteria bacterium]|nr:hypothetical protein [Acidobacteriota bacterium]
MGPFVAYWLRWPSMEALMGTDWGWSLCEILHFAGLALLVGIVGMFDLRLLGMAKAVPVAPFRRFLPWAVVGFVLCVVSGLSFVTGIGANLEGVHPYSVLISNGVHPYSVLIANLWLQLKLLFIALAGLNLLAF